LNKVINIQVLYSMPSLRTTYWHACWVGHIFIVISGNFVRNPDFELFIHFWKKASNNHKICVNSEAFACVKFSFTFLWSITLEFSFPLPFIRHSTVAQTWLFCSCLLKEFKHVTCNFSNNVSEVFSSTVISVSMSMDWNFLLEMSKLSVNDLIYVATFCLHCKLRKSPKYNLQLSIP
jgi:hypothetical protein